MYIPPLNAFLQNINMSAEEFRSTDNVTVSAELFKFMIQLLLANGSFNEAGYLRANPDVGEAIKGGHVPSARLHYIGYGFFEGRTGATPDVDETWYRKSYTDVDQAIKKGQVKSAVEHFTMRGSAEGRSPNAATEKDAQRWKTAFGQP